MGGLATGKTTLRVCRRTRNGGAVRGFVFPGAIHVLIVFGENRVPKICAPSEFFRGFQFFGIVETERFPVRLRNDKNHTSTYDE